MELFSFLKHKPLAEKSDKKKQKKEEEKNDKEIIFFLEI